MPDVLWYLTGVIAFVVGLGASIALHEVGHLVPAKRFGVRVTQYMIGFGPTVWSKVRGETEYGVKAIPLGGYIRMIGMFPPARAGQAAGGTALSHGATVPAHVAEADAAAAGGGRSGTSGIFTGIIEGARAQAQEEYRPGDERRSFYALKVWQKLVVMLGGPVMNLVLGTVLLGFVITVIGTPETTTRVSAVSQCVLPIEAPEGTRCTADDPAAPAVAAGVRPGDRIVAVAGEPTPTWNDVTQAIRTVPGRTVSLTVERDGATLDLSATPLTNTVPAIDENGEYILRADGTPETVEAGFLGVSPTNELTPQPVTAVPGFVGDQLQGILGVFIRLPQHLVGVAEAAFGSGERDPDGPISVVGVGRLSGEIASADGADLGIGAEEKIASFLGVLGGLNLALFVFNLVPLLPLDGGHAAGAVWEGIRKMWARVRALPDPGPVDVAKALPLAYGVAVVLLGMSVLLIYADIVRPIRFTG